MCGYKIVLFIQNNINKKINNINIHQIAKRNKRGLIKGKVVKYITGNLNAEDGRRFDEILRDIQRNEKYFENQLKLSYSINHQIIRNFKKKQRKMYNITNSYWILQRTEIITENTIREDILFAKNLYNKLIILYITISDILSEIYWELCLLHFAN